MFDVGDGAGQPGRGPQRHRHVVVGRLEVGEDQPGGDVRAGGEEREEQQRQHPAIPHTVQMAEGRREGGREGSITT